MEVVLSYTVLISCSSAAATLQVYQDLCKKHPTFRERSENADLAVGQICSCNCVRANKQPVLCEHVLNVHASRIVRSLRAATDQLWHCFAITPQVGQQRSRQGKSLQHMAFQAGPWQHDFWLTDTDCNQHV